jgi:hypothetical protein
MSETFSKVEVITGVARRRRFPMEEVVPASEARKLEERASSNEGAQNEQQAFYRPSEIKHLHAAFLLVIVTGATFAKADDYADGLAAVQRQDYDLAIRMFTPLAETGSIHAQTCRMDAICGKPPATSA